jgi:1-acyl-sn-glycerol-3-phosphate acyltransferase
MAIRAERSPISGPRNPMIKKESFPIKTKAVFSKLIDTAGDIFGDDNPTSEQIIYRNLSIKEKIRNKFFHPKQLIVGKIVEGLSLVGAPDILVCGKENLEKAMEITKGKNLIFMLRHISNFDTPAFELALRRAGFGEIVPRLIYLQGIKLDRNPVSKIFQGAFNRIKVWPPSLNESEKENGERVAMTKKSLESSKKALEKGYILGIYGEGGRSYTGELKQLEPAVIHYLTLQPNTVVLPVAISGTDNVLPPGSFVILPTDRVKIDFAEPINVDSLVKEHKHLKPHERRKKIADFIGRNIAKRLRPRERGAYSE